MTLHLMGQSLPALMHPERFGRNGRLPEASCFQRLAYGYDFLACRAKKMVFLRPQNFRLRLTASSSSIRVWPFAFRTGVNTTSLDVIAGLTKTDFAAASPPTVTFNCRQLSDDASVDTAVITYHAITAGLTISPADITHKRVHLEGLVPDTEYWLDITCAQGMALAFLMVHETQVRHADDTEFGVCNPSPFVTETPILTDHIQDLVDASNRVQGEQLLSFSCDYEESNTAVPTTSATSYGNLLGSTCAQAYLATQYRDRYMAGGVIPVKIAVRAKRTAGTGTGSVRIYDGTNELAITGMAIGSSFAWFTATGEISATPASWDLQALVSVGTTTMAVSSICVWEA